MLSVVVAEQDLGVGGEGAGDGDALLLAAGELGGKGFGPVAEADHVEQLLGALVGLFLGHARELQGEADVGEGVALHEQVEALEYHADLASRGAQLLVGERGHVRAVDCDGAAGGPLEQVHAADQRALARAGEADDAEDLARLDVEGDVLESVDGGAAGAEGLAEVADFDKRQKNHPE